MTHVMKTIDTVFGVRTTGNQLAVLGMGAVTVALVFLLASEIFKPTAHATGPTWTATLTSADDPRSDRFGYEERHSGSITDRTFEYNSRTYGIDFIQWDESDQKIQFGLDECLKGSEFVSLAIGSTTYSNPDYIRRTDSQCDEDMRRLQDFEFHNVTSNPLTAGTSYQITITLAGSSTPPPPSSGNTWTATLTSADETGDDEYGYEYNDFGSITDRTFEYDGTTYTIDYIKWDDSSNEIEFRLEECLKSSDFISLTIGSTTYSDPGRIEEPDADCDSNPTESQEFEFHDITSNPLTAGRNYQITITFAESSTPPPPPSSGNTWTATLTSADETGDDEYGYEYDEFGYITDRTFEYDGSTYTIDYIKWDDSSNEIEFRLEECLKSSDFVSLGIGSTTYSNPDRIEEPDADCDSSPTESQEFEFHDITSNPLTAGRNYQITITLAASSTPTPTPTPTSTPTSSCETSLSNVSGTVTLSGTWADSCASVNRSGRYAKFYSFTLNQQADVRIDLTTGSAGNSYTLLLEGSGTSGTWITRDDDGGVGANSQITRELSAGTYTVEATTYASGETGSFTLTILVTQPHASNAPSPTGLAATAADSGTSIDLTWNTVTDAASYQLEHRIGTEGSWTINSSAISTASSTVAVTCGDTHYFRVSARGDGAPYSSTTFGPSSLSVSATTYCMASTTVGLISDDGSWTDWSGEWSADGEWQGPAGATSVPERVRFNISFTGLEEDRAYVVKAGYETAGTTGLQPLTLSNVTAPSGYKELGDGRIVWVAGSSSTGNVRFEASAPITPTGYLLSVTKPDVVFIEQPTATSTVASSAPRGSTVSRGTLLLPLKVRNSSSASVDISIIIHCKVVRTSVTSSGTITTTTTTTIPVERYHGRHTVPGTSESELSVSTFCQNLLLKTGDEIDITAYLREVVPSGTVARGDSVRASGTVTWQHEIGPTLFHHRGSNLVGGLQISTDGWCTSSFTLDFKALGPTATPTPAISTTEHCAENDLDELYQGPYQLGAPWPTHMQVATVTEIADAVTCRMLNTQGNHVARTNCTIGDHSYGLLTSSSSAVPSTPTQSYIFKPHVKPLSNTRAMAIPRIEYYAGNPSNTADRFQIRSARPPVDGETVDKIGRSTGWTRGTVDASPTASNDPTCPGGRLGLTDNVREGGGYIECLSHADFYAAGGDSGSPVFARVNGSADEKDLVGVVYAEDNDEGIFMPIDRIYAESLKQGYDWSPAFLRPVPAPLDIDDVTVATPPTDAVTLTIKAAFDKALFSPTLFYRADLLKVGTTTPFRTCYVTTSERGDLGYQGHSAKNTGVHANCEVSEESRTRSGSSDEFTVVIVSFTGHSTSTTGSFTVRLRGCMEHSPSDRCGGYGSDGSQTLTRAAAP